MKKVRIPTLCIGALLLARAGQAQEAAPRLDWRLSLQQGQEVRVRRELYASGVVNFGEQKVTMKSSLALVYSLQVLGVAPDGTARARLKLLSFGFRGDGGKTFYGPFSSVDSSTEDELRPYRLAAKSSLELSIGPRGEVDWKGESFEEHRNEKRHQAIARRGPDALEKIAAEGTLYVLAASLRLLLSRLPQEPVQPGQKWSRTVRSHFTQGLPPYEISSTLSGLTDAEATLKSSTKMLPQPEPAQEGVIEGKGYWSSSTQIQLDRGSGWPSRVQEDSRSFSILDPGSPEPKVSSWSKQRVITTCTIAAPPGP
jgi:hypothetical protein